MTCPESKDGLHVWEIVWGNINEGWMHCKKCYGDFTIADIERQARKGYVSIKDVENIAEITFDNEHELIRIEDWIALKEKAERRVSPKADGVPANTPRKTGMSMAAYPICQSPQTSSTSEEVLHGIHNGESDAVMAAEKTAKCEVHQQVGIDICEQCWNDSKKIGEIKGLQIAMKARPRLYDNMRDMDIALENYEKYLRAEIEKLKGERNDR